jgi:glycosyltransferase involved in cell wall biosynthesis
MTGAPEYNGAAGNGRRPIVALVTDAIAPYNRGGKEERYRELAPRLNAAADVHVYTMNWWRGARSVELDGVPYHAIAPYMPLYSGHRRSIRQALGFALACTRLLFVPFDVVEADHMPYLQLFVLRAVTWLRRRRLVVTWHESWPRERWTAYLGPAGNVAWAIEQAAMRLPDCIVAASPETTVRVRKSVGRRTPVYTAPNGIDARMIRRIPPADESVDVVSVGRMLSHKRFDLLLDAVATLAAEGQRVRCLLIGDGPERDRLAEQAQALGIDGHVQLRHDVASQEELIAHVKAARCFAFPSEREGFGIAALEAIACGTPVITTTAPDNLAQALVKRSDRGTICEPTAEALAAAIRAHLQQGAAAGDGDHEEWVADYDWDVSAANVMDALRVPGAEARRQAAREVVEETR